MYYMWFLYKRIMRIGFFIYNGMGEGQEHTSMILKDIEMTRLMYERLGIAVNQSSFRTLQLIFDCHFFIFLLYQGNTAKLITIQWPRSNNWERKRWSVWERDKEAERGRTEKSKGTNQTILWIKQVHVDRPTTRALIIICVRTPFSFLSFSLQQG